MADYEEKKEEMRQYQKEYRKRNYARQRELQTSPEYKARRRERYKGLHPNSKPRIKIYKDYKESKKAQKKRVYQRNTDFILEFKREKCCSSCGYKEHPEILQFHHTRDKLENISQLKKKSLDRIKKEIEKCILLCPNCHFLLHSHIKDKY